MPNTENEFIDSAKRLIDQYQRKIKRLQSIVSDWELDVNGQRELSVGPVLLEEIKPVPRRATTNGDHAADANPVKASDWIRFAVQHNPEHITTASALKIIQTANPATEIDTSRVSTGIYQLCKNGELEPLEDKSPGKPALYRATAKFRPWRRFKRLEKMS